MNNEEYAELQEINEKIAFGSREFEGFMEQGEEAVEEVAEIEEEETVIVFSPTQVALAAVFLAENNPIKSEDEFREIIYDYIKAYALSSQPSVSAYGFLLQFDRHAKMTFVDIAVRPCFENLLSVAATIQGNKLVVEF